MITKSMTLLEIVENNPEREAIIKKYDSKLNTCLLCQNLFDSIEKIEKEYETNLETLIKELNQ